MKQENAQKVLKREQEVLILTKENSDGDDEAQEQNFLNWTWQRNSSENRTTHVLLKFKKKNILISMRSRSN